MKNIIYSVLATFFLSINCFGLAEKFDPLSSVDNADKVSIDKDMGKTAYPTIYCVATEQDRETLDPKQN